MNTESPSHKLTSGPGLLLRLIIILLILAALVFALLPREQAPLQTNAPPRPTGAGSVVTGPDGQDVPPPAPALTPDKNAP